MLIRKTSAIALVALAVALCAIATTAALAATGYEVYAVQPGDTLAALAQRFGVEARAIAEFNGIAPDAALAAGQSLSIPIGPDAGSPKAQEKFSAEEKQAADVAATELSVKPAVQARSGPVVGYLGIAVENTAALLDPRRKERLCTISRGTNLCVSCQYGDYWGIMMADGAVAWVPKAAVDVQRVELVAGIEVPAGGNGSPEVVQAAFRYYGLPYLYGGTPPGPTDCSGLVQAAFRDCGMALPRTAAAQFMVGYAVPFDQLAVGDRLYFVNGDGYIGHAALYIGNGQFIHASSRRGYVGIDSLRSGFYRSRLAGARRP
jgi:cell wall-associated NlpC family hydrolase